MTTDEKRCSRCKHYQEVWHPQPGVNWDRCKARIDAHGEPISCARNVSRDCIDFQRRLFVFTRAEDQWWRPYF